MAVCSAANAGCCRANGADQVLGYDQQDVFAAAPPADLFLQVHSADGLLYDRAKALIKPGGQFLTLIPNPLTCSRSCLRAPGLTICW